MMEYKSGCKEALEELFQRYKNRILNYAVRMLKNLADAEDVVSEVFCTVATRPQTYTPSGKFSTWIYTIAHNFSINRIRGRKRLSFQWFKQDPDSEEYQQWDIPDTAETADEKAASADTEILVKKAIDTLPDEQKEAIILREYQSLSYDEISKTMRCSLEKVKILIFRARERLKNELHPLIKEVQL